MLHRFLPVLVTAMLAGGCASLVDGQNQSVSVLTPDCPGAACRLHNDKGRWHVATTPASVVVNRSFADLVVNCSKDTAPPVMLGFVELSLGFGERLKIADGMYTAPGSLTSLSALSNDAELANLSIGQGKLLLTPISMLPLYCAIASDGTYRIPSLVEGTVSGGSRRRRGTCRGACL